MAQSSAIVILAARVIMDALIVSPAMDLKVQASITL